MTLPIGIICVSDRRLTGLGSGAIKTNRSTKMTVFGCADAHGVIVYNGIGMDDAGKTPSDWLMELAEKKLFDLPLAAVLEGVSADLETRLRTLRARHGPRRARHTFIFLAFGIKARPRCMASRTTSAWTTTWKRPREARMFFRASLHGMGSLQPARVLPRSI
jgi:hypothetical protein